ncbi:MAG: hypothetical protein KatS3mg105_4838 [Gemmatales bacterium]|nr:MAG: hypothetical protein KatS3mg105_4838 [Gemmatales bacterium]
MSKKSRAKKKLAQQHSETAVATGESLTNVTTSPAVTSFPASKARQTQEERFWLESAVLWLITGRVAKWLGSLQLAVILLSVFAVVLTVGTIVESWYDNTIAMQLVYRTWWFNFLLFALGVNIFFAAAKKWPWKRHQVGFLITHSGLILLIAGGIVNGLMGTDAMMVAVDSDWYQATRFTGAERTTNTIFDQNVSLIRVKKSGDEKAKEFPFQPGPLQWHSDEYAVRRTDKLAAFLFNISYPWPFCRRWKENLGNGATLEVLNSYPHVRRERFGPARTPEEKADSFVAIRFELESSRAAMAGKQHDWVADKTGYRSVLLGPAFVELLGTRVPSQLIDEFLHPPESVGDGGSLVLYVADKKYTFDVDAISGKPEEHSKPIGNTGWRVSARFISDDDILIKLAHEYRVGLEAVQRLTADTDRHLSSPMVLFLLEHPGKRHRLAFLSRARRGGEVQQLGSSALPDEFADLKVWFHPPDPRYGEESIWATLQFLVSDNGQLYYRSYHSDRGANFRFESAGKARASKGRFPIWQGMNWKLSITDFVQQAIGPYYYAPENRRPGLEDPDTPPAIRCRLTVGNDFKEFWLPKTNESMHKVTVGKQTFEVGYNILQETMDFEITLLRAEMTTDKGSSSAASYTSYVLLSDNGKFSSKIVPQFLAPVTNALGLTYGGTKIKDQPHVITMNQPLYHRGYKLFQSGYTHISMDDNKRPINRSVFSVSRDPGLWLKYLGSLMLAFGIATMFYMDAYGLSRISQSRWGAFLLVASIVFVWVAFGKMGTIVELPCMFGLLIMGYVFNAFGIRGHHWRFAVLATLTGGVIILLGYPATLADYVILLLCIVGSIWWVVHLGYPTSTAKNQPAMEPAH